MTRSSLAAATFALLVAPAARGAPTEVQLQVAASSGFTDNAQGAVSEAPAGTADPDSDVFFSVSPSVRLWRESSRLVLLATLGASLSRYASATESNSSEVRASLQTSYNVTPTLFTTLGLTGSYLDTSAIDPEGIVGAVPTGAAKIVTVGMNASGAKDLSKSWRLADDLRLSLLVPVGDDTTQRRAVTVGDAVAVQFSNKRDALEGRLDAAVNVYADADAAGATQGSTDTLIGATGTWFRELSPFWGLAASAGATVARVQDNTSVAPLAKLSLTRLGERWAFNAALAQAVQANLLLAETLSTTDATVSISTQLAPKMQLSASGGGSHARVLDGSGRPAINSLRTSARLDYIVAENFSVSLSHDFLFQLTGAQMGSDEDTTLLRNRVTLSLTAFWQTAQPRVAPQGIQLRVRQSEERDLAQRAAHHFEDSSRE